MLRRTKPLALGSWKAGHVDVRFSPSLLIRRVASVHGTCVETIIIVEANALELNRGAAVLILALG